VRPRPEVLAELAALLAELVDARVEERLAAHGIFDAATEYDGDRLPPHTTKRAFFAACRDGRVAGARRDGRGWICSHDAWRSFRERGAERPVRGVAAHGSKPRKVANDVEHNIDEMLRSAGLRGTQ
jgi:hypothetical protein